MEYKYKKGEHAHYPHEGKNWLCEITEVQNFDYGPYTYAITYIDESPWFPAWTNMVGGTALIPIPVLGGRLFLKKHKL